jgi:uncharacterized membrane protein YedE/YeeE
MGCSGIITPALKNPIETFEDATQQWKLAFLSSLLVTSYVFLLPHLDMNRIAATASTTTPLAYAISGLLVGFGTKLGNGCTSGHGICGLARLSKRSFTAVCSFMGAAVVSTMATTSLPFFQFLRTTEPITPTYVSPSIMTSIIGLFVGTTLYQAWRKRSEDKSFPVEETQKRVPGAIAGALSAVGFVISTMVYPDAVRDFLNLNGIMDGTWNPTLMMVMGGAVLPSFLAYQFVPQHSVMKTCPKLEKPLTGGKYNVPTNTSIDRQLIIGTLAFGAGWGITGACPGPAVLLAMTGLSGMVLQYWPAFYIGSRLGEVAKKYL